ncbi:MAG: RdgB/HAM1 family non-canonical purine NTP pyrophosphatase [Candidatus Omnitrophica bacterium]|nr:RdgB/HAM1 family non-canonical purine NTP pyrophosphatase [Candidatus Omnitrophota bacterium]
MRRDGSAAEPSLVLGTKNEHKRRELERLLKGSGVKVLSLKSFPECPEPKENGKTFEANARKKATYYSRHTRFLTLADDSGLSVSYLKGKPGVLSARFAGEPCSYADNNRKLLGLLGSLPSARRQAKFVCVMALYDRGLPVKVLRGECTGRISFSEKGRNGFGYDPVFIPKGFKKTFAEIGPAAKNKISHRGKALRLAKKAILAYFKN